MLVFALALVVPTIGITAEVAGKVRVVDGDSLRMGSTNIRLFGIDAPENDQFCLTGAGVRWACGAEVTRLLRDELEGKTVRCDLHGKDDYGRDLAVCFVDGRNLNGWLVEQGWAFAFRRYSMMFDLQEKAAFVDRRGLHAHEVMRPAAHRRAQREAAHSPVARRQPQMAVGGCNIKGNISASGKIYHMPGQSDYTRTRINLNRGERMFCTEAEAQAAGWRKARR